LLDGNIKQKRFGSMYINGWFAAPNTPYPSNDGQIAFEDTAADRSIPWIWVNDTWIAGAVYALGVTWVDLNRMGYIFGRPVRIDGKPYLCRSLKVGEERDVPNEWDAALDATCSDDELWRWNGKYFVGQECMGEGKEETCVIRGMISPRDSSRYSVRDTNIYIGFRPVLEELPAEPKISDELRGSVLTVYGQGQALGGILVDYTDYDLILVSGFDIDCPAFKGLAYKCSKEKIVINRAAITYLSTTDDPQHPPATQNAGKKVKEK